MRKKNPSDICDDFHEEIETLETFLLESWATSPSSRNKSLMAELVFHRAYVAVESFISAWIVGAINRDAVQYFDHRTNSIRQSITEKFTPLDLQYLKYSPPAHPNVSDVESLLDHQGRNITFRSFYQLRTICGNWLAPEFLQKVQGVPTDREKVIDAAKAIRNCIAHQSKSSIVEMNRHLAALPNRGVCASLRTTVRAISDVGAHLKTNTGGSTRVQLYLQEFRSLGLNLK